MSRVGLGRHGQLDDDAGDPLDGLVNMFDLGLVLAVAFLIAGLGLRAIRPPSRPRQARPDATSNQTLTTPSSRAKASGQGHAVGQVYQLPDGRLVLVRRGSAGGP